MVDFTDAYMDTNLAILLHKDSDISNVDELLAATNYSYGTLDSGWNKAILMSSRRKPYSMIWANMASSEPTWFVKDNEDGVLRALNEQYGYTLRKPMAQYFAKKDCRPKVIETILGNDGYGLALPKQSRRLGEFNAMLRRMEEDGFMDDIKDKWWKASHCPYPQYAGGDGVNSLPLWVLLTFAASIIHLTLQVWDYTLLLL